MSLIGLLVAAILIWLIIYVMQTWSPPSPIREIIYVIMLLILLCALLNLLGFVDAGGPVLRLR